MPKLEDQISPQHLLAHIRSGARKGEITKEFRTNDRELAHALLPLYRSGDMTKEEFNDFFKGLAAQGQAAEDVKPPHKPSPMESRETENASKEPAEGAQAKPQGGLAKWVSGLWQVSPPPAEPTGGPPSEAAEPHEVSFEAEGTALPEERQRRPAERRQPRDRNDQVPIPSPPSTTDASVAHRTSEADMEIVLRTIFARLDSIDARLSRMESRMDLH